VCHAKKCGVNTQCCYFIVCKFPLGAISLENGNDRVTLEGSLLAVMALWHGAGVVARCGNQFLSVLNCTFRANSVASSTSGTALYLAIPQLPSDCAK
jgi:hypothetical protein